MQNPERSILNIAGYKFVHLKDAQELRLPLRARCRELGLRGTILLSEEGINIVLSGYPDNIKVFLDELGQDTRFQDLTFKESFSETLSFNRMLVKFKKEIIAFGLEGIDPEHKPAPNMPPKVLKEWLDQDKDFILLDTRNDYEIRTGTFEKAQHLDIKHFRIFPKVIEALGPDAKKKPIVTFCTGGIRCEKAAPFLLNHGFEEVYQLEGGILKYFEECGDAHYQGDCFVFDNRVAVSPNLEPTPIKQCFKCRQPLTPEEQKHPHYQESVSCPYCYGKEKK
jgi:predicted sulfurtransferase